MGYEDVDVTLRLRAIDETDRIMADAARRAKSTTDAMVRGMTDVGKATLEASRNTQKLTEGLTSAGRAAQQFSTAASNVSAMTKAMGDYNISTDRMARGMAQAGQAAAQAAQAAKGFHTNTSLASSIVKEATNTLLKYAAGFTSVTGAIATVNRGFTSFAEGQRGMDRIQLDTNATSEQMTKLGKTIGELKRVTGESGTALRQNFSAFREQTGLAFDDSVKLFDQVAKASHAAGTNFEDMSRSAVAAITNFKVPQEEVSAMLDTWVKTIPASMMGTFAAAAPRIMQLLHGIGYSGKQSAEQVASAFSNLAVQLGNTRLATQVLEDIFTKATDINNSLGMQTVPMIQKLIGTPNEIRDSLEAVYQVAKQTGYYDTKDLAQKSMARSQLDMNDRQLEALQAQHKEYEKVNTIAKQLGLTYGEVEGRMRTLNAGAQKTLDSISASTEKLYTQVGRLFNMTGIPNKFGEMLESDAQDAERIANAIERIINFNVWRDREPGGGKAPGEGSGALPGVSVIAPWLNKLGLKSAPSTEDFEKAAREKAAKTERDKLIDEEVKKAKAAEEARAKIDADDRARRQGFPGRPIGKYATGGEFTVPGSGRGDDQPVSFLGTPGERVTVESIPAADTKESLQRQQDKADIALREHFARFHGKSRAGTQLGKGWPGDILGRGTGAGGSGGQASGTGAGSGPLSGGGTSGGGGGDGKTGTPGVPGVGDTPLNTPVGLDPASPTGPAESLEEAYKRGYLPPPSGGSGGLAGMRAGFATELKDPVLQQRFLASVEAEVGGQGAAAKQAFMETVFNRAANRGMSLNQAIHDKSFFPSMTLNKLNRTFSGDTLTQLQKAQADSLGGSDITKGATGNYSVDKGRGWGPTKVGDTGVPGLSGGVTTYVTGKGEYLGKEGVDLNKGWEQKYQTALKQGSGGPGVPGSTTTTANLKRALEGSGVGTPAGDIRLGEKGAHGYTRGGVNTEAWLIDTVRQASKALPEGYRAEVISTVDPRKTGTKWHPAGQAIDIQIYDKDNKPVTNVGKKEGTPEYAIYERMALAARQYAEQKYPDKKFIWGGHFNSGTPYDLMHFQSTGTAARGFTKQQLATPVLKPGDDKTKVAGPAAISDIETRAAARYKAAVDRAASTAPTVTPTTPAVTAPNVPPPKPVVRTIPPPGREGRAAGKGGIRSAPAPVVRPVSAPGTEDTASGKGPRPAPVDGLAEGGIAAAGRQYLVGEDGPEMLEMGPQSGVVRNRWQHMPQSGNVQDSRGAPFLHTEAPNEAVDFTWRNRGQMEGGLTDELGGGQLDRNLIDQFLKRRNQRGSDFPTPGVPSTARSRVDLEPVIRPRIQQMGPLSMRWSRQSERQRHTDISRDQARTAHTDQGFA